MTRSISTIGLFCEDIREEKSGQDTIIGIMPDNINVPTLPAMVSKLGIYIRIQVNENANPKTIKTLLKLPDGQELALGSLDNLIAKAKADAKEIAMPFPGLIAKSIISPFPIREVGKI